MSVINTNITSMIGQQNLNKSQNDLQTSMERLSSGLRINSAKDDAAGQAIANRMSSQITGLAQAQRNANDGISVAQTAEGALNQVNDNLQRVRELAVQAENGTNSQDDLDSIQNEIDQRLGEIDRISDETTFNGTKVLQSDQGMQIQVGANDGETITIDLKEINAKSLGMEGFNVNGAGEVANEAATLDSLTLAGAVQVSDTNEYELSTQNGSATSSDVLSALSTENSSIAVGDATYTVNADGDFVQSQTYTDGASREAIADAMTPAAAGETVEANVTIGGESTRISVASDGSITNADSGNTLRLDTTGNLTETSAGDPDAATIDSLATALSASADAEIEFDDGTTFTTASGIAASPITDGDGALAAGGMETAVTALATDNTAANRGELSITVDGTESTVYVDNTGNLWANNTGSAAGDEFTIGGSSTQATANDLDGLVASGDAQVTIAAVGDGDATNVGNTYTVNRDVDLSGQVATADQINDAIKTTAGTHEVNLEVDDGTGTGTFETQNIEIVSDGTAVTGITFTGDADTPIAATGAVNVSAGSDGGLTDAATTDVSYWAQENGNITNDSGQRIYEDAEGALTTDETTESERSSLSELDGALSQVDSLRSDLGAIQNRMESAIENLGTTETNLSAARSRIEDADYAVEVANMTRSQILQQAGTSVLAQANQIPQNVLSLLG
jgi:flagellin